MLLDSCREIQCATREKRTLRAAFAARWASCSARRSAFVFFFWLLPSPSAPAAPAPTAGEGEGAPCDGALSFLDLSRLPASLLLSAVEGPSPAAAAPVAAAGAVVSGDLLSSAEMNSDVVLAADSVGDGVGSFGKRWQQVEVSSVWPSRTRNKRKSSETTRDSVPLALIRPVGLRFRSSGTLKARADRRNGRMQSDGARQTRTVASKLTRSRRVRLDGSLPLFFLFFLFFFFPLLPQRFRLFPFVFLDASVYSSSWNASVLFSSCNTFVSSSSVASARSAEGHGGMAKAPTVYSYRAGGWRTGRASRGGHGGGHPTRFRLRDEQADAAWLASVTARQMDGHVYQSSTVF